MYDRSQNVRTGHSAWLDVVRRFIELIPIAIYLIEFCTFYACTCDSMRIKVSMIMEGGMDCAGVRVMFRNISVMEEVLLVVTGCLLSLILSGHGGEWRSPPRSVNMKECGMRYCKGMWAL